MPFAMPANFTTNNFPPMQQLSSYVQEESSDDRASRNINGSFPGSTVLDMEQDNSGRPHRAHIREANGQTRTVTLDDNQCVGESQDGYR